jgi:hypothetical protein
MRTIALLMSALAALPALAQEHEGHAQHGSEGMNHDMPMEGALGSYPMSREASGTAWQPDAAPMHGYHTMAGDWMVMLHGYADVAYDYQGGKRGDEKAFVASMFMGMAQRPLGGGTLGLRAMLSGDPFMGKKGYPLLFQTGETADGVAPLTDRQHPHDAFMELAATYSVPVGSDGKGSLFGYVGLPGEPALGPPAFMHRASGVAIPEAPLTHHWLDSTHITFGVVTLGATWGGLKLEGSAFNGREPDQFRWNIETDPLDSWSARVTWNPASAWSLQASHGRLVEPEQLEPEENAERSTASVSYVRGHEGGYWATTLAAGVNEHDGEKSPGYLLETVALIAQQVTLFARVESLSNGHLVPGEEFDIGKLTLGGSHRVATWGALTLQLGALASAYAIPTGLEGEYGSKPLSGMLFARAAIG